MGKGGSIADVHCPKCGAPAKYDIIRGSYQCGFCGSSVELSEAMAEKQGFREMQQEKIRSSSERYQLMHAACSGCGKNCSACSIACGIETIRRQQRAARKGA